jgi:hypothetical protein
MLQLRIILK